MSDQRFNLLPHRQIARNRAWQIFSRQVAVVAVMAFLIGTLVNELIEIQRDSEGRLSQTIQDEIKTLSSEFEKSRRFESEYQRMLKRQHLIEDLDSRRSTSILILNHLIEALPREVYLTRLEENGERFVLEGRAVDAGNIARFFEHLAKAPYLQQMALGDIRAIEPESVAPFQFTFAGRVIHARAMSPNIGEPGVAR